MKFPHRPPTGSLPPGMKQAIQEPDGAHVWRQPSSLESQRWHWTLRIDVHIDIHFMFIVVLHGFNISTLKKQKQKMIEIWEIGGSQSSGGDARIVMHGEDKCIKAMFTISFDFFLEIG